MTAVDRRSLVEQLAAARARHDAAAVARLEAALTRTEGTLESPESAR